MELCGPCLKALVKGSERIKPSEVPDLLTRESRCTSCGSIEGVWSSGDQSVVSITHDDVAVGPVHYDGFLLGSRCVDCREAMEKVLQLISG